MSFPRATSPLRSVDIAAVPYDPFDADEGLGLFNAGNTGCSYHGPDEKDKYQHRGSCQCYHCLFESYMALEVAGQRVVQLHHFDPVQNFPPDAWHRRPPPPDAKGFLPAGSVNFSPYWSNNPPPPGLLPVQIVPPPPPPPVQPFPAIPAPPAPVEQPLVQHIPWASLPFTPFSQFSCALAWLLSQ